MALRFKSSSKQKAPNYIAVGESNKKYEIVFKENGHVKINRKNFEIEIIENEGGFNYIQYKKKKYPVEIIEKSQNKYQILLNGVSYSFSIESPFSYKRKKHLEKIKTVSKKEFILAPMPGKIVDILVEENTLVKEGESILILEAMKMQNEIISHANGKVSSIKIKPEDTVMKDDVLLEIEK